MKKLVCGCFGTIYYAEILKNGTMSSTNRTECTDDAIRAVMEHIMAMPEYDKQNNFAGYVYSKKDGNGKVTICVFDENHKVVKKNRWNNFNKAVFPTKTKRLGDYLFSEPIIIHLNNGIDIIGYANVTTNQWFDSRTEETVDENEIVAWQYYETYPAEET